MKPFDLATKCRLRSSCKYKETFTYCEWRIAFVGSEAFYADMDTAFERLPDSSFWLEYYIPNEGWYTGNELQQLQA